MTIEAVKKSKRYRNIAEDTFSVKARGLGWEVTKCGYPDFICYLPDGRMILVEVKTKMTHKLKKSQRKFMNSAKKGKILCYKWSPDKDWLDKHNVLA